MSPKVAVNFAMSFEGQTTEFALWVMYAFIEKAQSLVPAGALVEFGTYKGRVAGLLGAMKRPNDELHLIDVRQYLERDKLEQAGITYSFHLGRSEEWRPAQVTNKKFCASHHDASHYFTNVLSELSILSPVMDPKGIMILDDFSDPYNQVRAAYYYLRYTKAFPFELILISFGKAFLVRTDSFALYEKFILDDLQSRLSGWGLDTVLARTDVHEASRAFSMWKRTKPDEAYRYGLNTWGDQFYRPTR